MLLLATTLTALLIAPLQQADTTITVAAGTRLEVAGVNGDIIVNTWNRREIRVEASYGDRSRVELVSSGSVVRVRPNAVRGGGSIDYRITVPSSLDLKLEGLSTDITVSGTPGQVEATTRAGDIRIAGATARVRATTLSGDVTVQGARADVEVLVMSGDVTLIDVRGPVQVEAVSGDITMQRLESTNVAATAVSGDIRFSGSILPDGRYEFEAHSGDIVLALPSQAGALVTATAFSGSVGNTLPRASVSLAPPTPLPARSGRGSPGQQQRFFIGNGSAVIEATTFSGRVQVMPQ